MAYGGHDKVERKRQRTLTGVIKSHNRAIVFGQPIDIL